MTRITLKGNPINTVGKLPAVGSAAPDFKLTAADLSDKSLADFKGKQIVFNIFPSLDTSVCAMSVRKFNQLAADHKDTVVLCASADLPFAHGLLSRAVIVIDKSGKVRYTEQVPEIGQEPDYDSALKHL